MSYHNNSLLYNLYLTNLKDAGHKLQTHSFKLVKTSQIVI